MRKNKQSKFLNRVKPSKRNYGDRVDGPWVFGMVCQKLSDIEIKQNTNKLNYLEARAIVTKSKLVKSKMTKQQIFLLTKKTEKRTLNNKSTRLHQKNQSYKSTISYKVANPIKEVRMFYVEKRDAATLNLLLNKISKVQKL